MIGIPIGILQVSYCRYQHELSKNSVEILSIDKHKFFVSSIADRQ